ncbi:hypothetical protein JCM19046_3991 [Bacillus sp. JCM 19046]|nr:hypothetical protein JCM19045_1207 [Bacillus sp. JCM 19045]GAF19346.1 hypothetical protein JCM19046_3991 [Bacillus sp. JCM 19046]
MHSKQTVKYVCEEFTSGYTYYFKQEYITHDKWSNLDSVAWSSPKPISRMTFIKRQREGYVCEFVKRKSATIMRMDSVKERRKEVND